MSDPTEALTEAVQVISFIQSMYFDQEFQFASSSDEALFTTLFEASESNEFPIVKQDMIECYIRAPFEIQQDSCLTFHCRIHLSKKQDTLHLPFASNPWLTRDQHEILCNELKQTSQEEERASALLEKIQEIQALAEPMIMEAISKQQKCNKQSKPQGPIVMLRDWIWFPMIYTREKRGHIVDWAPKYGITGFLCPGKPGAMCLEGKEKDVVRFINDIKTVSWADIPASHRKMTSRWKQQMTCADIEQLDQHRLFEDMKEVTFDIHGQFANHNNLSMLQAWMTEKGCGEAFEHLFEYETQ
ncbi:hypothetical protein K501DRAFT_281885 [Backusella circina FSU 941]|nr:hypothetical protein K501DRAFT_281885 [Backusella circina FSU 941]